jgi:hypothetical protein
LRKLVSATADLAQEGILTEAEVEALLKLVISRLIATELDRTLKELFSAHQSRWLIAAEKEEHEGKE